jgi:hypothetical protein
VNVEIAIGETTSVTVEADDNVVPLIETRLRGSSLVVENDVSCTRCMRMVVRITVPELEGVSLAGSGDILVDGLAAGDFEAALAGSGDIEVSGTADRVEASLAGSGDIDLGAVQARAGKAAIAGSGDITLWVTESLEASVAGSGDINYRGDPDKVSRSVMGSGSIKEL